MAELVWQDPPEMSSTVRARKQIEVGAALKSRPGQWALIDTQVGLGLAPWWGIFHDDRENFEMRFVWKDKSQIFGPRDIYARYIGGQQA